MTICVTVWLVLSVGATAGDKHTEICVLWQECGTLDRDVSLTAGETQ